MIPTYFAGLVILSAFFAKGDAHLRWLLLWSLFGASSAIDLPALGGSSLPPVVAFLPFIVVASLRLHGSASWIQNCRDGQPGFWLLLVVLWGFIGALFLPRLFLGAIDVLTIDRLARVGEPAMRIAPLKPVSSNLSQSAYAIGSLLGFLAVRSILTDPRSFKVFNKGVIALAIADVTAGLWNAAELYLGLPSVTDYIRNGGYAILNQGTVGGLQRIFGTFAETSSFAGFSLPLLAYLFSLWRSGVSRRATGGLCFCLLMLLLLSTSTTAYAGLLIYGLALMCMALWKTLTGSQERGFGPLLAIGALSIASVALLGIAKPDLFKPLASFFEVTFFGKLDSDSGMERGSWNQYAWTSFVESDGIGVGLGSARASSFALVVLSNLGALGAFLYLCFLLTIYIQPPVAKGGPADIAPVVYAARHAVFVNLIVASISAAVFDLGTGFYAMAATACGYQVQRAYSRAKDAIRLTGQAPSASTDRGAA